MLQSKVYNAKKNLSINSVLNITSPHLDISTLSKQINKIRYELRTLPQVIKSGILCNENNLEYSVLKEEFTNTYFLSFPHIIIFHINDIHYPIFSDKYLNDDNYLFHIYKSENLYHIICFSHVKNDLDDLYLKFCLENYSCTRTILLSSIFLSFLILNDNYKDNLQKDNCQKNKMVFVEKLGLGENKYPYISNIIHFYNSYITYSKLPINYLSF